MRTQNLAPRAGAMIESMRDIGYSLESALADIIDNSISAFASNVHIHMEPQGALSIAIVDNGCGMDEAELIAAMRPGSKHPFELRGKRDLGRFGLGLKTASFSQCRRLTVVSRKAGVLSAAVWDLDRVEELDDWIIELPEDPGSIPYVEKLGDAGTLVLWEKLDRLAVFGDAESNWKHLTLRLDDAIAHLALVFHRFLAAEKPFSRISILVNGRQLEPFDPFNTRHPATVSGVEERIQVGEHVVVVRPYTIPHHSKVTPAEWNRIGGDDGYIKNQGFYLYREGRLIMYGTWFGLMKQTELTKLARVRIDMPNGMDSHWKIDVKKASAQPPAQVRARLKELVEVIGGASKRIYTVRGVRRAANVRLPVWNRIQGHDGVRYEIGLEHPILKSFADALDIETIDEFKTVLDLVQSTLPIEMVFADMGASPTAMLQAQLPDESLRQQCSKTFELLRLRGMERDAIVALMHHMEPFMSNLKRIEPMLAELDWESADE